MINKVYFHFRSCIKIIGGVIWGLTFSYNDEKRFLVFFEHGISRQQIDLHIEIHAGSKRPFNLIDDLTNMTHGYVLDYRNMQFYNYRKTRTLDDLEYTYTGVKNIDELIEHINWRFYWEDGSD